MENTQILWCENTELRSGWRVRPHSHDFFHMIYVACGNIRYLLDEKELLLSPDDLILIPPGVVHENPSADTLSNLYEIKFRILNQELLRRFETRGVIVIHNASISPLEPAKSLKPQGFGDFFVLCHRYRKRQAGEGRSAVSG